MYLSSGLINPEGGKLEKEQVLTRNASCSDGFTIGTGGYSVRGWANGFHFTQGDHYHPRTPYKIREELLLIFKRGMGYCILLFFFLSLSSAQRLLGQTANTTEASPEVEKIKQRVTEYYTEIKSKELKKAAELVLPKSRKRFLAQKRDPVDAFRIIVVKMEEGGTSAAVEASISTGGTASFPYRMEVRNYTRWRLMKGSWYCDIDNPPQSLAQKMEEYSKTPQAAPGPLLGLSAGFQVKFDKDHLKFGTVPIGPPVTLRFPFTNVSAQPIKVENIYLRADFLKNKTEKGIVNPHEKGEVIVELDTSQLKGHIDHSFVVEFQPIKEMIQLYFKGLILPPDQMPIVNNKPPADGTKK
jgi:uncharacterized protein DUF1573